MSIKDKNNIALKYLALTSDGDTTTLGSRHGQRAAMLESPPITAGHAEHLTPGPDIGRGGGRSPETPPV